MTAKGKHGQVFYPLDYMSAEDRFEIIREKYPFARSHGAIPDEKKWEGMSWKEREIAEQRAMKLMEHEAVSRALPCPHCGWPRVKISRHRASGADYEVGRKLIRLMCKECGCSTNYEKTLWEAECKWNERMARYSFKHTIDRSIRSRRILELEAEKAALLADLKSAEIHGICSHCEHSREQDATPPCEKIDYDCANCNEDCICRRCIDGSEWKWRGVQAEKPANVCG